VSGVSNRRCQRGAATVGYHPHLAKRRSGANNGKVSLSSKGVKQRAQLLRASPARFIRISNACFPEYHGPIGFPIELDCAAWFSYAGIL